MPGTMPTSVQLRETSLHATSNASTGFTSQYRGDRQRHNIPVLTDMPAAEQRRVPVKSTSDSRTVESTPIAPDVVRKSLRVACSRGDLAAAKAVIAGFAIDVNSLPGHLLQAISSGHADLVKWLMDFYDSASELDDLLIDMGLSAIRNQNFELLKDAVSRLTVQGQAEFGYWTLPSAVLSEDFLTFLFAVGIKPTRASSAAVLNECAARSTPRIFDILVDAGADITAPGVYPLHQAAGAPQRGRIEMMEHLVRAHGFDLNGMDNASLDTVVRGSVCGAPLHYAVGHGYLLRSEWLLKHGADPHYANQFGNTPFDEYAIRLDADSFTTAMFRTVLGLEDHN
ncbi:ankyrin repeat-containing domain protein [Diaporthe sp. PMI_573]|nr:ankyrin repeat-containing domain protein [Diaporthaceae sp. PMI_573]